MNRQAVVSNALWGAEVATRQPKQIHYGEVRPIRGAPRQLPLTTDCSGFVTLCYQWAGAPDPNGTHYDGTGSTGTMLRVELERDGVDAVAVAAAGAVVEDVARGARHRWRRSPRCGA
jgi:hypothetical protein